MEEWLPARWSQYSVGWSKRVERMVKRQLLPALDTLRLDRIGRPHVKRWFDALSRKMRGAANKALTMLRQIVSAATAARRPPGIIIFRSPRTNPPLRDSEKEPVPRHPVVPDGRADHIVRC